MPKDNPKEATARALYERNVPVGPTWDQLGAVTKSVWIERVSKPAPTPAPRRKSK